MFFDGSMTSHGAGVGWILYGATSDSDEPGDWGVDEARNFIPSWKPLRVHRVKILKLAHMLE